MQFYLQFQSIESYGWLFKLSFGLVFLFVLYFFCTKIIKKIKKGALLRIPNLEKLLFPTLKFLLGVLSFYYVIKILGERFGFESLSLGLKPFKDSFVVLAFAWMVYKVKQELLKTYEIGGKDLFPAFSKILTIFLFLLTGLIILRLFSLDIVPLLAFSGIGAAALGFAAKDVMSSFFGGILLSMTRPFSIGDLISLPSGNIEGYVEEIGWCLTALRDKDKKALYLPNSLFPHTVVVNASRRTGRRVLETFHVRFVDFSKVPVLIAEIKETLASLSFIDSKSPILVFVSEIGSYAIECTIDCYTMETSWKDYVLVKDQILQLAFSLVGKQGAQIAFPVSLSEEP